MDSRQSTRSEFYVGGSTKYRLQKKIGSGSFGDIYLAVNINSGEEVAVKLESQRAKHPQLLYESKVCKYIFFKALNSLFEVPCVNPPIEVHATL